MLKKLVIGITMGDASGIGPEIIVKALSHRNVYDICAPVVIGDPKFLKKAIEITNSDVSLNLINDIKDAEFSYGKIDCFNIDIIPEDLTIGKMSPVAGDAAFQFVKKAVELAKENKIQAICTAPLNKEAMQKGGHKFAGHTEILAELTNTKDYSMMLSSPKLKVIHLTTHVGLVKAVEMINPERTYRVIKLANDVLTRAGYKNPKIAVSGINPHAGENGLFGNGEEEEKLIPGIKRAQEEGIEVSGPYPPDTVFFRAVNGDFDIVVACYHDQGHIPIKVLGMSDGINVTVGLNGGVIRTSVDHGTAFDIAGKNIADEKSMLAAIKSAVELVPKN
ncbi:MULTISPECIES: 4-hydroxythreonine-4-phosphate dehydrogenase PdxA [Clostridium]|uniref:Putative D-threonate 4-phosphate dehydrogenase n=2 Tax=Clostridium TaxID=1485 RepID=D8GLS1_CLOLD|nr:MULTISPECIES: 4-hydroxythreonine-4-phosphate dehydrogenase PdxA [Clostridium]ADK13467.1 4-hydroxythreonine-4-phosphate dehydrogenase [Clostridium ljungdahlii DSM 13528]AGY76658.1 4-hydroxythreonine-4-phosphate dehydrogenase PdxA [Clostridium autoethanogenum DSM 10061]ALU36812.1 4-hydroxythreonine-4-phosphate dehydrogenase [Clostridium autoethanogenum DSM 10061]OAA89086.1 4-hydroxythreonine-4-phosphate dehydrogenase 2 [Clostridium ljungdahlii DSM 13528]OVY50498.1 4-hydroxythreonine-4-phospha